MKKPRRAARLRVSVTDARGRAVASGGLSRWLVKAAPVRARGAVSVAIVGDAVMRRLNRDFRGVDHATDVLTFPSAVTSSHPARRRPHGAPRTSHAAPGTSQVAPRHSPLAPLFLGDIAIATGVARRQARAVGHTWQVELRVLALHGLLHLLGYDHETDRGEMHRTEERLRRRAGLPAGLIARAPTVRRPA